MPRQLPHRRGHVAATVAFERVEPEDRTRSIRSLRMRVLSLDAYRGFVMLLLVSEGLPPGILSRLFGGTAIGDALAAQFGHVPWMGCHLWDLIQPSFMFLVGAAIPYSYAARLSRGQSVTQIRLHAAYRAAILVLLGIFVTSDGRPRTAFDFHNILGQIGLSYLAAFWLVGRSRKVAVLWLAAILVGTWIAFALYPAPPPDFDYTTVGLVSDWKPLGGLFAHWNRNVNLGTRVDQWFLNLFPREAPYRYSLNGLQTLNFVPSIATVGAGLLTAECLRAVGAGRRFALRVASWGAALLAAGLFAGWFLCPIVKAIWTPSWVVFSTGWVLLFFAGFHELVDVRGHRRLAWPLLVAGANSITLYLLNQLLKPWLNRSVVTHLGEFSWTLNQVVVSLALWGICVWMYRRSFFLRI